MLLRYRSGDGCRLLAVAPTIIQHSGAGHALWIAKSVHGPSEVDCLLSVAYGVLSLLQLQAKAPPQFTHKVVLFSANVRSRPLILEWKFTRARLAGQSVMRQSN